MNSLKIIFLSSVFLFANCSLINDKFFSRSNKTVKEKPEKQEEEIVMERVYIEDEKEEVKIVERNDGLQGDIENQNNIEYPNLADVPERPDPSISIDEQDKIVKDLENKSQLQPVPSKEVYENKVPDIETSFTDVNVSDKKYDNRRKRTYENTKSSIKDVQLSKLQEIKNFKPTSDPKNQASMNEEEKELHNLAKELKNIKTQEQIIEVEDKIKKNDLYYTPQDIEKILGIKKRTDIKVKEKKPEKIMAKKENKTDISKNIDKTIIEKKQIEEREVPVARVTFNHGSSHLSDEDLSKIKKVANLFYENEGKKIVIVGHASSRTNYDMDLTKHALVNFNISLERARTVMKQFSTIGFNSQRIELVAMSDAKPLYAEIMPRLEAANRRAEIYIQY